MNSAASHPYYSNLDRVSGEIIGDNPPNVRVVAFDTETGRKIVERDRFASDADAGKWVREWLADMRRTSPGKYPLGIDVQYHGQ